ncbi:hypothetical protein [Lysinibacillus xylanilyticus]|uniref:hypothetical protein n=1 Tax=Lysinibacillus xylanilyticus TaxID=582475 RepID=UPI0036D9453B
MSNYRSNGRGKFYGDGEREQELHLEILELYAETGDYSLLEQLGEVNALHIRNTGVEALV